MSEAPENATFLRSTDGTALAIFPLGERSPAHEVPLLVAHATGFCGRMYEPLARATRRTATALDFRGHGDSARPEDATYPWHRFGEDALETARHLTDRHGPVVAFGHSMGGAALLMAALSAPELFAALYVYEPIVLPPGLRDSDESPMVAAARRRRDHFPSRAEALENFRGKKPLSGLSEEVLELYVEHGFGVDDDGVRLKCRREDEAQIFATSGIDGLWERLPELSVPTTVAFGGADPTPGPHSWAPRMAELLPHGHGEPFEGLGHLGPFEDPSRVGRAVEAALAISLTVSLRNNTQANT